MVKVSSCVWWSWNKVQNMRYHDSFSLICIYSSKNCKDRNSQDTNVYNEAYLILFMCLKFLHLFDSHEILCRTLVFMTDFQFFALISAINLGTTPNTQLSTMKLTWTYNSRKRFVTCLMEFPLTEPHCFPPYSPSSYKRYRLRGYHHWYQIQK